MDEQLQRLAELARQRQFPSVVLPEPSERRAIRLAAGVTLREMADAVGVNLSTVRAWEVGGVNPHPAVRARYAEALAVLREATAE